MFDMNKYLINNNGVTEQKHTFSFGGSIQEDAEVFIGDFISYIELNKLTVTEAIATLRLKLHGEAKIWYINQVFGSESTLEERLLRLKERFSSPNAQFIAIRELAMMKLNAGERMIEVLDKIATIGRRGGINEVVLIGSAIRVLPREIGLRLCELGSQETNITWKKLYDFVRQVEPYLTTNDYQVHQVTSLKFKKGHKRQKMCKICEKSNHWTDECFNIRKLKLNDEFPDKKVNKKELSYLIFDDKNYAKLKIKIFDKAITALIDTGADSNFINSSLIPRNYTMEKPDCQIIAANGTSVNILGEIRNVNFRISEKEVYNDFLISNNVNHDCILGLKFLQKYVDILKFNEKRLEIKWKCDKKEDLRTITNNNKLKNFNDLFIEDYDKMGECNITEHKIITEHENPICRPVYRLSVEEEKMVSENIKILLKNNIIRRSESSWRAPIVPIKKPDGTLRMCIDYRELNKITKPDAYPMPRIDEILDELGGATVFSKLDAFSGNYQVKMSEKDIEKTAFGCKSGIYEFCRMPFGLVNGPATFQRMIDMVLRDNLWKGVIANLDDIIIYANNLEEHDELLEDVLNKLKNANLKLNNKKSQLRLKTLDILGYTISNGRVSPSEDKIKAINNFRLPKDTKELQSFLGLVNFCRKFIKNLSKESEILFNKIRDTKGKNMKLEFDELEILHFENVKKLISDNVSLKLPDLRKKFILTTDASNTAIGAVLSQKWDDREEIVSFSSRTLNSAQRNYSATDKELLAIRLAIKNYRNYLAGKKFLLRTDHKDLSYMFNAKDLSSRITRWSMELQEYDMDIEYVKGEDNFADTVSRLPVDSGDKTKKIKNLCEIKNQGGPKYKEKIWLKE